MGITSYGKNFVLLLEKCGICRERLLLPNKRVMIFGIQIWLFVIVVFFLFCFFLKLICHCLVLYYVCTSTYTLLYIMYPGH